MRTQAEIVTKIEGSSDFLGFDRDVYIGFLDYEHVRKFLKEGVTREEWDDARTELNRESILASMREYMDFAWGKVRDHRCISASRSVDKMRAWAWLLGDEQLLAEIEAAEYTNYGAPKLAAICYYMGWPVPGDSAITNMVAGRPCVPGCCEGCG